MTIIRRLVWKTDQRNSERFKEINEGGQGDGMDNFLKDSNARVDNQETYNHVEEDGRSGYLNIYCVQT